MNSCGICLEYKIDLYSCINCAFKICINCHIIGVKLKTFSGINGYVFYCSSSCFFKFIWKYWKEEVADEYNEIIRNNTDTMYVKLIRETQLEYFESTQLPKINAAIQTYIDVKDLCNLICEYVV